MVDGVEVKPSFPRRRENEPLAASFEVRPSSNKNSPRSGQSFYFDPLRGDYSINWIPACAGMTSFWVNGLFGLNKFSEVALDELIAMRKIAGKLFGFALLAWAVMGLFVVLVSPFEMYQKLEAESWPSRKGVVTISYANFSRTKRESGFWDPQICGYYTGSGERFCIARVRYGGFRFGEGKALAFDAVARYPVGRAVDVFYSPGNPKATILEAHSSWKEMFTLFGLGLLGVLLPVILWVFRKKIDPSRYGGE